MQDKRTGTLMRAKVREGRRRHLQDTPLYPVLLALFIVAFWQYALPHLGFVRTKYLGSPAGIVHSFRELLSQGYEGVPLIDEILASVRRVLLGFAIGALLATPIGLLMGYKRGFGRAMGPLFSFLRPVPALAFIPVMLIWFGISDVGRIVLIAMTSFLYIVLATSAGVAAVPESYLRSAQNYHLSSMRTVLSIVLPASLPSILIGFRTGMALSWAVVVAAELIAAQRGLGYMIKDAATFFRINEVYVGIILIGIIGVLLDWLFLAVQRRALHWVSK
ncbi:MAG: ABC transporter permease [Betaproteobacteria bacterium]|nr:ABC transporter permease [Betaproteobacteria bacterium]